MPQAELTFMARMLHHEHARIETWLRVLRAAAAAAAASDSACAGGGAQELADFGIMSAEPDIGRFTQRLARVLFVVRVTQACTRAHLDAKESSGMHPTPHCQNRSGSGSGSVGSHTDTDRSIDREPDAAFCFVVCPR